MTGVQTCALPILTSLWCNNNKLSKLDVSNNVKLDNLHCYENQLTTLDISNNLTVISLDCEHMNDANANNLLETLIYSVKPEGSQWDIPEDTNQIQK